MERVDIAIIGAGVIGLSVAAHVSRPNRNVFILEKNHSWGQETSSRNSEVIHAGIYYPPGTLKAMACREGRNALYALCRKEGIGVRKTGKLIVAVKKEELDLLYGVQKTASQNGVDLIFLSKDQVRKIEPEVVCEAALHSPETGIVDSHHLMKYFLEQARSRGAELVYEADVSGIDKKGGLYRLVINNQGELIDLYSPIVINCAGNNADKIASMTGIDIQKEKYQQYYLKGNYFRLSDQYRHKMTHLVYPVPNKNSLGIHTVLDLSGGVRLGPDDEEVDNCDYQVNVARRRDFYQSVRQFLPSITEEALTPDIAGIRPQLKYPNCNGFKDFIIAHEADKGLNGFINLVGIESPGLTASPYIGKYVSDIVDGI